MVALDCQEKRIGVGVPHHRFDFRLYLQQALPPDFIIENVDGTPACVIGYDKRAQGVTEQRRSTLVVSC